MKGEEAINSRVEVETQFAMCGRDARSLFKKKTKRGDPDKMPSYGTQPLGRGDDAASQGRQDDDFETPQATQSAVLFPFPN